MSSIKSFDEYKKEVKNDLNKYKIIESSYNGSSKPLLVFCKKCNKEFKINAKHFKNGQGCPDCANEKRKKSNTIKLSQNDFDILSNKDFEVIEYNGKSKPAILKHSCGFIVNVLKFSNFIKNPECLNCKIEKVKKINKNIQKYQNKLDSLNIPIEIIPDYFVATNKLSKFRCKECNELVFGYYTNFITNNKSTCSCQNNRPTKNIDYYREKLNSDNYLKNNYKLIDETFKSSTEKMKILHLECGRTFDKSPVDFFSNHQLCTHCSKETKKTGYTKEEVIAILYEFNMELLSDYKNSHTPIKCKCLSCGRIFEKSLNNIKNNNSLCKCAFKNKSHGEYLIEQYLLDNNINYISEHIMEKMVYKSNLRFDFYLSDYNLAIEFNGIQHYKPVEFFGGEEEFKLTQERDNFKKDFCNENNINLLIISYKEISDICNILNYTLIKNKL